jgi:catalase
MATESNVTIHDSTHETESYESIHDEALRLPKKLVDEMQAFFGKHPGYRTTHAKGLLVEGKFTPTKQAQTLSTAPHFSSATTPVIARFSVGGGLPHVADVDDGATPKGIAIRFKINHLIHTDLIGHSFNGFPAKNGEDFLSFLQLFRTFKTTEFLLKKAQEAGADFSKELEAFKKAGAAFQAFLAVHPAAAAFALSEKPNPFNYGTIKYYEPNTHVLTNKDGKTTNVRYRLDPVDGEHLYPHDKEQLAQLGPNYLEDDLKKRFPEKPISFIIQAHIANHDDDLEDATVPYKSTTFVEVGRLEINKVADNNVAISKHIAFSPTPESGGIKGIASSKDPLIQTRKGVYWISTAQRRLERQKE